MSSSRRARRRRRHERYGKPSYQSRPKNGLTPTAGTTDEWISPHLDEECLRVITSERIDWGRSYLSYDFMTLTSKKKEEPIRYFRTKFFLE